MIGNILKIARYAVQSIKKDGIKLAIKKAILFMIVSRHIYSIYKRYIRLKLDMKYDYTQLADPFKLRWVNPHDIKLISVDDSKSIFRNLGTIEAGDWDLDTKDLNEYDLYTSIINHFQEDVGWKDTDFYHRLKREIESGNIKFGCESVDDIEQRLHDIDQLYASIDQDGYKSMSELNANNDVTTTGIRPTFNFELNEVVIDISRDGEPLLVDGRHRVAIATALDIEKIPVIVARRHKEWQRSRERAVTNRNRYHFDLVDTN